MTAGHFALATGMKRGTPRLPLWVLMLSTYLLDVIFIVLFATGVEGLTPIDPSQPAHYGGVLIHAYYTHSLLGALLISGVAGLVGSRFWGRQGGMVIGAVAFSHWLLDLLMHRPDLPLLPDNWGNLPLLGLGLWAYPTVSMTIEFGLIVIGAYLYYRSAAQLPTAPGGDHRRQQRQVLITTSGISLLLLLLLGADVFSL